MACSIREAMLSARATVPVREAAGRILADAAVSCPPAVPVAVAGERITEEIRTAQERMDEMERLTAETGDGSGELLLGPQWSKDKKRVLNAIRHEMKVKGWFYYVRINHNIPGRHDHS